MFAARLSIFPCSCGVTYSRSCRYAHHFPTPTQVLSVDIVTLRSAGLSQRKAEYIQGLADKFVSGELSAEHLIKADDDEVLKKLTGVR
jgi:DNA-3-methyladenine glycosylase II